MFSYMPVSPKFHNLNFLQELYTHFVLCLGLVHAHFTHIIQGFFIGTVEFVWPVKQHWNISAGHQIDASMRRRHNSIDYQCIYVSQGLNG